MERQELTQKDWTLYEEIKLETEEDNREFLEEANAKNIEIKMEIPSAPEEETEDLNIEEDSDEESDVEEDLEEEEDLEYDQVREHNRNVVLSWYAKCAEVGLIPKEFETLPETENEIKVLETINDVKTDLNEKEAIDVTNYPEKKDIQEETKKNWSKIKMKSK